MPRWKSSYLSLIIGLLRDVLHLLGMTTADTSTASCRLCIVPDLCLHCLDLGHLDFQARGACFAKVLKSMQVRWRDHCSSSLPRIVSSCIRFDGSGAARVCLTRVWKMILDVNWAKTTAGNASRHRYIRRLLRSMRVKHRASKWLSL